MRGILAGRKKISRDRGKGKSHYRYRRAIAFIPAWLFSALPLITAVTPNCMRTIPQSFAWIDHRLHSVQWIADFEPEEFALYLFLALVADQHGLSCWRFDIIERAMPRFGEKLSELSPAWLKFY